MVILIFFSSAVFWKPPPHFLVCFFPGPLVPYHTTIGKIHTPPPKPPPQPKKP